MDTYIYDLEQFKNFHCGIFFNIKTKETKIFILHDSKNDFDEYIKFLLSDIQLIGFNNINYDYPLLHYLIKTRNIKGLYNKSKEIINSKYSSIYESEVIIPQIDLYKIWHFDNKAKRTSLKKIQIALRWKKVQDLPLSPDAIIEKHQIPDIIKYCINDVDSTYEFYLKSLPVIELRKEISKIYNINVLNKPDAGIGESIFKKLLSEELNTSISTINQLRTYRKEIKLKDCILPYVKYSSKEFNNFLSILKNKIITETKGVFKNLNVIYKNFKYEFGTGGIHGCISPGRYSNSNTHMILDIDVKSYYPNLAISNNFYPKHLGLAFCKIYKQQYEIRKTFKKGTPQNYVIKIALNGSFGKSNSEYSFLYDPLFTMNITINGQLLLTMLSEKIVDLLYDVTMLQINTDGLTILLPKSEYNKCIQICKSWEKLTNLELEYVNYKQMIIRDVNNYIACTIDNKIKYKGAFEIERDWHKNHSMKAVRIAISNYFLKSIPIEQSLNECNIFDFCKSFTATKGWATILHTLKGYKRLQKTNRYIISNSNNSLYKHHEDGRIEAIESGFNVTILNDYDSNINYLKNINMNYYIRECYKIINVIENKQLTLF